ncbi:unnamed protein product [Arctia plantaginis]|uniref:39S ribosomal protein L41, mitochondrial n=1 Tax=Arctia plantaginis TaxID=874455 RepID=A0A8S1ASQ7_ARCPL|nr:unnamed protein product [Arctia plantaginis]
MSKINSLINYISKRSISITAPREGKRNFRKFVIANKRGSRLHKQQQMTENRQLPMDKLGVRDTGYYVKGRLVTVPEMIPDIIVPDLKDFDLKPKKIVTDFKQGKLDSEGNPLEPSEEEKLQPDEAVKRAKRTGSDIF